MNNEIDQLKEWQKGARRELNNLIDEIDEKREQMSNYLRAMDMTDELIAKIESLTAELADLQEDNDRLQADNERLQADNDSMRQQLSDEKQQRNKAEMQLNEMSKLSTDVAKKSSEENVLKALRKYVNRSKRKTADKRAFAKSATLEIANANGLDLPEDLKADIDALDDEQPDPKVMNVAGDYVLEKNVEHQVQHVAAGGTGISVNGEEKKI